MTVELVYVAVGDQSQITYVRGCRAVYIPEVGDSVSVLDWRFRVRERVWNDTLSGLVVHLEDTPLTAPRSLQEKTDLFRGAGWIEDRS